ncbi:MAG: hypothetical protein CSA62_05525 [Planctomycetota bacterium]|nr:MAG: hypothetical protein CSA62_05525 [Planctomycetota bacterium]
MSGLAAISVILPVMDPEPGYLRETLASLLGQTHQDFEVLIVEAPGKRSAAPLLEELGDPRLRLLHEQGPGSMAKARMQGIAEARHELVAMIDGDDVAEAGRFAKQAQRFAEEPGLDVLGTALTIIDENSRPYAWRPYPLEHQAILRAFRRYNAIAHPSVMLRKAAVLELGGYRHSTCEDYELWCRMARAGRRFANLREPLLRYRIHHGATKSRRLRASILDTLRIKREHWGADLGLGDRFRMLQERALLLLPPRLVLRLFEQRTLQPLPEGACASLK